MHLIFTMPLCDHRRWTKLLWRIPGTYSTLKTRNPSPGKTRIQASRLSCNGSRTARTSTTKRRIECLQVSSNLPWMSIDAQCKFPCILLVDSIFREEGREKNKPMRTRIRGEKGYIPRCPGNFRQPATDLSVNESPTRIRRIKQRYKTIIRIS